MNSDTPERLTVTIITPSFNQGKFIEETIVSVLSQPGEFYLDYIIMDGGSTDNSVAIIRKYDQLLQEESWPVACRGISYRWASGKDKGQADAINKGFTMAEGKIVGWLNSDDTYLPEALSKMVEYLKSRPDIAMVYGNAYYTDRDGVITSSYPSEPFSLKRLAESCFVCQPTAFIRIKALNEVGPLDVNLQASMDYELWIRIGERFEGRIAFMEDYLANSRMYQENKTKNLRERVLRENLNLLQKHFGYVKGVHIASCFYDVYKNPDNLPFYDNFKKLLRSLFVVRYLFNRKTFNSSIKYFLNNIKKIF